MPPSTDTSNYSTTNSPPSLLRGILVATLSITLSILAITWLSVEHKIQELVNERTSEYAHVLATLAANSSAEALLAEDDLQLNMLVENVAKDPYILRAVIYSEDGKTVAEYPRPNANESINHSPEIDIDATSDASQASHGAQNSDQTKALNEAKKLRPVDSLSKHIGFIESITYKGITAGWFKVEIDKTQLETNFRESFFNVKIIVAGAAILLFSFLVFILVRFEISIKQLVHYCDKLLMQRQIKSPKKKKQWLQAVKELTEDNISMEEHKSLPLKNVQWTTIENLVPYLCLYLDFSINIDDSNEIAGKMNRAESYLNLASQTLGMQFQGDILTGCIVPVATIDESTLDSDSEANNDYFTKATLLFAILDRLFSEFDGQIRMQCVLSITTPLVLKDNHDIKVGITFDKSHKRKLLSLVSSNETPPLIGVDLPKSAGSNSFCQKAVVSSDVRLQCDNANIVEIAGISPEIARLADRQASHIEKLLNQ